MTLRYGTLLLVALALVFQTASAQTFFTAKLTSAQEPGDVEETGAGTAAFALTDEGLRFFVTVDTLTGPILNAHFHHAEMGVNGGFVRTILNDFDGNTASGIWTAGDDEPLTDELITELLLGNLYLNVHTDEYQGGEIRGQIFPTSGAALTAKLTPEQETGDVESDASGTASVQLTDAGAIFFVTVDGLSSAMTNAHFHEAAIGVSAGTVRAILDDFDGNTAFGVWRETDSEPLTAELRQALLDGNLYLNVHTSMYGPGEIRGQVLSSSGWGFHASLDPDQETEEVTSDGTGTGTFTLTSEGLLYQVTVDGLTGPFTNAHFHRAPAGEDGDVVREITGDFEGNTASGLWTATDTQPLTDALIRDLIAGNIYVNVHTDAYQTGEIRGQVLLRDGAELAARLTPEQEFAGVESDGSGTAAMTLTEEGLAFRVTVNGLTGAITNAHFHDGEVGVNGPPVRPILNDFEGNTAVGIWTAADSEPLSEELVEALLKGDLYINVHTADYTGGEIRGQVLVSEGAGLKAFLTNEQASQEVTQEGSGTAALTVTDRGVVYDLTVTGLTGDLTNAHFHTGAAGVDGGVIHGIGDNFEGNTASGVWEYTDDQALTADWVEALVNGEMYLNIHTMAHQPGEIRGQVVAASGIGAAVQLDPEQEVHEVESEATGTASLSLTHAGLAYDVTVVALSGPITASHFHQAPLGEFGDVVHGIGENFVEGTASGLWQPSDAAALTPELLQEVLAGNTYINVHTGAYSGGEVRGQVLPGGVVATSIEPVSDELPKTFALEQNYPNPFNPVTTIEFSLTESGEAVLAVYDVLGRLVATLVDGVLPAGDYRVQFNARDLPSGAYIYKLAAGDRRISKTMLVVK